VRGEFHFATTVDIAGVADWPARGAPVERMLVVDRSGALAPVLRALPERFAPPTGDREIDEYCDRFANWLVLAYHVAARGEWLRAWDALGHAQRHLLWMARLAERSTTHWLTPSRGAEADLSPATVAALRAATGAATPEAVAAALRAAWVEGRQLWRSLANRLDRPVPVALFAELDAVLDIAD
jgi:lincosamide nucleotidyltransferase